MEPLWVSHPYQRRKTRVVTVGPLPIGGDSPVSIQSMTTTPTSDVAATLDQVMELADAGCQLVRLTVQGMREVGCCEQIKNRLVAKGYLVPIVADVHFYPKAAISVVNFVDKVRINPGNFVNCSRLSDEAAQAKIAEQFIPLIDACRAHGNKPLRIGVNHGSLSARIQASYGDTPEGMVASALEFAHIARKQNYHQLIFSMKSSDPQIVVAAYRLLVDRFDQIDGLDWDYPLHLGLTESGEGTSGRAKSVAAVGLLLSQGLGDTIRLSLTEPPVQELPPCRQLITHIEQIERTLAQRPLLNTARPTLHKRPGQRLSKRHRRSHPILHDAATVCAYVDDNRSPETLELPASTTPPDLLFLPHLHTVCPGGCTQPTESAPDHHPVVPLEELESWSPSPSQTQPTPVVHIVDGDPTRWSRLLHHRTAFILLQVTHAPFLQGTYFFDWLAQAKLDLPVILWGSYTGSAHEVLVQASLDLGTLLLEGYGEGILLEAPLPFSTRVTLSFEILQAARLRTSTAELIACPGCGRTLFDLQQVTRTVGALTRHLVGVKIAVMGCIVNGPGEMADADFGYVGAHRGKVDLYRGRSKVASNIPAEQAPDRLIELIKQAGKWVEPPTAAAAAPPTSPDRTLSHLF